MSTFLSAAGVGLVLWAVVFLYFRSYLARRTSSERILSEFRDEVGKLVAEIDAATDRDVQLVEDRIKALKSLLEEAEKRIGTMRREIDRRSSEERAYSELGKRNRSLPLFQQEDIPKPARSQEPQITDVSAPAAGRSGAAAPPVSPVSPEPRPAAEPVGGGAEEAKEARFMRAQFQVAPKEPPFTERVAELYRAGFSAEIIANRLGKTVGEVDLVIALSGKMEERNGDDTGN